MASQFQHIAPDRLQIRQGGGCMALFGLPFFAAGVFLTLTTLGLIPVGNADEMPRFALPVLALMSVGFTSVGGMLAFGRSWIVVDATRRAVLKQWGLLVPMHERTFPLDGYTAVTLGFVEGDSDTSDQFPIGLKARAGADLPLCSFTAYAESWKCAVAVAQHLRFDIEDATTDHPVRVSSDQAVDSQRRRHEHAPSDIFARPAGARSDVQHEAGQVRIVIPHPPVHPVAIAFVLIPVAIPMFFVPSLIPFFRQTQTPDAIGWIFIAFLTLVFGILPVITVVNGFLRARRGATIVEVSPEGLRVLERGAWKTRTLASLDAADIVDVDYSTQESALAAVRRAADQQVLQSGRSTPATLGPRMERLLAAIVRSRKSRGLTVKTRHGLTTFGTGLDDDEVRYLNSVVRRALSARAEQ